MKRINVTKSFPVDDRDCLQQCMVFIEESLEKAGIIPKLAVRAQLISEEVLTMLIDHAEKGSEISIQVRKTLTDSSINIRSNGSECDFHAGGRAISDVIGDDSMQEAIRAIILKSQDENIKYSHKGNVSRVRIFTGQTGQSAIYATIGALVLGLLVGLAFKLLFPAAAADAATLYVLEPLRTMFMNALKIIIAPVAFFSIATCIAQFKNIAELGRMGARVVGTYLFTTLIAVFLAIGLSRLINPGTFGAALEAGTVPQVAAAETSVLESLISTIVNIIPNNFVRPFLESDTLQVIFLAVLCGIAVGMIGEYGSTIRNIFEAFNALFLTITQIISGFIPVAVFCSVVLMVIQMGWSSFLSIISVFLTHTFAIVCMILIYGLLVLVFGRLNPLVFYRKDREGMLTSFTLSSSSAAMPTNMKICTDKFGISPKVSSFSVPLGSTINMDGSNIYLTIFALYLAKLYGVEISGSMLFSMIITIILLSLGSPGVPGAGLICLGVVLSHIGVPVEAIALVIAI
ncbi:MAG: dicarboxylate/amino acid:cation symporter, partial [Mogibacterium sp.]|nr:dicarboxylate/amino acid:cation symporter [Mogibacterium sp.]